MDKKIKRLVAYYIKKYETNNPFELADNLNISVGFYPLGNISGIYKYIEHTKCIFINSDIENNIFKNTVMAHELGHAILHWKVNCSFMSHHTFLLTSKIEKQANIFAAEWMISDDLLEDYKDHTVEQFANCTGIDKDLIILRLNNCTL